MRALYFLLLLVCLTMIGCGNTGVIETIKTLGQNPDAVVETVKIPFNQSLEKERLHTDNTKALIAAAANDAKLPLAEIEMEQVNKKVKVTGTIGGQPVDLTWEWTEPAVKKVYSRVAFHYDYNTPFKPSVHPGWDWSYKALKLGLYGFGIDRVFSYLGDLSSVATYSIGAGATINSPLTMDQSSWSDSHDYFLNEALAE